MAYFHADELVDCIRNVFAVEDNTGISFKILERPIRRAKAGGLPLNYGAEGSESDNDDQHSPNYLPELDDELVVESTSKIIENQLLSKLKSADNQNVQNLADQQPPMLTPEKAADLFVQRTVIDSFNTCSPTTSSVSRLLVKPFQLSTNPFEEYAKFEAVGSTQPSRMMTIVFPFCEPNSCALQILVITSMRTTLSDLIGLSCYVYTRKKLQPHCEDVSHYSLYLAEDNLEYDTELPPQDRHRLVVDCGFPVLALVKNSELRSDNDDYAINVHFSNGVRATFTLKSLDLPLQWLFDKAMEWRDQNICSKISSKNSGYLRDVRYFLESLEQRDIPLNLSNTISSVGCLDFVMFRENSSRGDVFSMEGNKLDNFTDKLYFHQSKSNYELQFSKDNFHQATILSNVMLPRSNNDFRSNTESVEPLANQDINVSSSWSRSYDNELNNRNQSTKENSCGKILEEYFVEKRHRIKPRTSAKLLIGEDGFELQPMLNTDRRKSNPFVLQSSQKSLKVFWEMIASAEVSQPERSNSRRLIRIIWLLMPQNYRRYFVKHSSSSNVHTTQSDNEHLMQAYELSTWKTLQLEVNNEDAWKIGMKFSDMLDARSSQIQRVYQYSFAATKRPAQAAELAMNAANSANSKYASNEINLAPAIMTISNLLKTMVDVDSNEEDSSSHSQSQSFSQSTISSSNTLKSAKSDKRKISKRTPGMVFSRMLSKPN